MGAYNDIVKIIESQVPEYTSLQIVSRGAPLFPDLLMTGEMRFGRRQGANLAVIVPDNVVQLTTEARARDNILNVSRILNWFEVGALVTFNGIEMLELSDWDSVTLQVFLKEQLSTAQTSGKNLILWATPIVVHTNSAAGSTTVQVRSRYSLLNGDVITFPQGEFLNSLTEREVVVANTAGDSGDSEFPFLYSLELNKALPVSFTEAQTIYLRAYPGYISRALRLPKIKDTQIGPFLVDYLASPLFSVPEYSETLSIRTLNGGGVPIDGTNSSLKTVEKNTPIINRPIYAQNMIFWKVFRGSGGFQAPNKFRMLTDAEGLCRVSTDLTPAFPSGLTWTMKVTANSNGIFRVYREPFGFEDYTLTAGVPAAVSIQTPPGGTLNRIDFVANMETANTEILIADTVVQGLVVSSIQYSYVFKVVGEANYQSTSLLIKPMFLSLADMEANYDSGQYYDSGLIYT